MNRGNNFSQLEDIKQYMLECLCCEFKFTEEDVKKLRIDICTIKSHGKWFVSARLVSALTNGIHFECISNARTFYGALLNLGVNFDIRDI